MSTLDATGLGALIWEVSRRDEMTISATGASAVADAILDSDWLAAHDRAVKAEALREAADEIRHRQHAESVRQMLRALADEIEGATDE